MLALRYKVFRLGLERLNWSWRFGLQRRPMALADLRARVEAFGDEVGPENVVSISETGPPQYQITVWYREGIRAKPKPARSAVDDEYFATAGR